ncbi:MAG TPA: hypothetical protein PKN70_15260 [Smithellaceae bacterium]|nr:hypothetical protein [Smithellaceae bacterium]
MEFELSSGDKCFCKGNAAPGKDFYNLTQGSHVRLLGKWAVSNNPQYKWMKEQFNFSDYELLSELEIARRKMPEVTRSPSKAAPIQNQEVISGNIIRFRSNTSNYRIFLLRATDGREFWCQGDISLSKTPYENNKIRLTGDWRVNPHHPEYGLQFYFTSYEIITPGKPEKVIRRPRIVSSKMVSVNDGGDATEKVIAYLKAIGGKKINYEYHAPKHTSIFEHVKFQLNERILLANKNEKDFFFLTALLDRNVKDELVQTFRRKNKNFKQDLLQCWEEAEELLLKTTRNIREELHNEDIQKEILRQSPVYRRLANEIPGDDRINQLLVCLKVINELYKRNKDAFIADFLQDLKTEKEIINYLDDIFGIGPKLPNWALTNVTGHWFVIDKPHIKPLIENELAHTIPENMSVSLENADAIFEHWFGMLDETKRDYEKLSFHGFKEAFHDFSNASCEYLPFIVTQSLWFYDLFYGVRETD